MLVSASSLVVVSILMSSVYAVPSKDANRNSEYCKYKGHTMCVYTGPSKDCKDATVWRTIDTTGQNAIVNRINKRRNEVANGEVNGQPNAANMKKMVWNDELAKIAQRKADQCVTSSPNFHDKVRNKLDGTSAGQNVFVKTGYRLQVEISDEDYDRTISNEVFMTDETDDTRLAFMDSMGNWTDSWYNEVKDFSGSRDLINSYKFKDVYAHYSQELWAETEEVGCGFVLMKDSGMTTAVWKYYKALMLCNFSPMGNAGGEQMYKVGKPVSDCPDGYSPDATYKSLCAKN